MAADEQDRRSGVAAGHFGDDIAGRPAFGSLTDQGQMHCDRLSALQYSYELLGIRDRQGSGGDRPGTVGEILDPRVRIAVMIRTNRPHDNPDRTFQGRDGRPLTAPRTELSVAGAV